MTELHSIMVRVKPELFAKLFDLHDVVSVANIILFCARELVLDKD